MPTKEHFLEQIERELTAARQALKDGNDGLGRVCARRAAGAAITWLLREHPHPDWGTDALRQLQHLKDDKSFPPDVRQAALRLTTKLSDKFRYPFSTDPLGDARIIIDYIRELLDAHAR